MSTNIFDLSARIAIDSKDVDKKLGDTQKKVVALTSEFKGLDKATSRTGSGLGSLGAAAQGSAASFASMAGSVAALGAGFAGVLGSVAAMGAGIVKLASFSQQLGGEIFDLSQKINFTAETLSSLKIAAELSGGSLTSLSTSLGIFDKNMEEAKDKTSEMANIFKVLKLDTEDNEKALRQAFTALAAMGSGAQQTAVAMKLFGRSGKEVLGIVKETGGNVDEFITKMESLGLTISTSGAKKADQFGDQLVLLQNRIESLGRQIGSELVPTVSKAADDISGWLNRNQGEISKTAQELGSLISRVYDFAKVVSAPFVMQILIMRRLIDVPAGGVAGIAGSIGASIATGLGADPEALRRAGRISAPGEGAGEYVIPGSSVPAAVSKPPALNLGGGGGGGRGGGRARTPKKAGQDFDEYYNLFDHFKKMREEQQRLLDDILSSPTKQVDALIRLYDTMRDAAEAGDKLLVGTGVGGPIRDLEEFMKKDPPEISKQTHQLLEMREESRQRIRELAGDITNSLDRAVYDGFNQGAKRGFATLAQGLLDIVNNIFLGQLEKGLTGLLGGSSGGGGLLGFIGKAIPFIGSALGGAAGGSTGFSGGAVDISKFVFGMAGGGVVPGVDRGYDSVPTMLRPGEVVLNKDQQAGMGGNNFTFNFSFPGSSPQQFLGRETQAQMARKMRRLMEKSALTR